jgi:hypothetical protein
MRHGWTAAVAAMVTLAVVPDGQAATVSIAHQGEGYGLNWTLWVVAQPGERNEIVVSYGATARSGPGNDVLLTRDGLAEIVVCGAGADRLLADPFDYVTPSCERR